jgi:hypothetical protein
VHNNRVENDIRPFAVGRRAWLFIDTQGGARASANLYTLAQTCRANGINAHAYFTHLYEHLPLAATTADIEALLPWNVKPLTHCRMVSSDLPFVSGKSTAAVTTQVNDPSANAVIIDARE